MRQIISRSSEALEAAASQPGMPERSAYPTHEAWLRAMLTASLQQSEEVQDIFGHYSTTGGSSGQDTQPQQPSSSPDGQEDEAHEDQNPSEPGESQQ